MNGIYLDYNATTPVDPLVLKEMLPYFTEHFGNAASASHQFGWAAESALKKSRQRIAHFLNCKDQEIYFTSGATESNNTVIFGLIAQIKFENKSSSQNSKPHIITTNIEHDSVINPLLELEKNNEIELSIAECDQNGLVSAQKIEALIKPNTILISVIWVQNEIGTIQPIYDIGQVARKHKIYFHSDATQAMGKIQINLQSIPVDMLSASGHKMYAPKGIGFLFLRSQNPKVQIKTLLWGGGQEKALRSGTVNVPGAVAIGKAAELCSEKFIADSEHIKKLRDHMWTELKKIFPNILLNGSINDSAYNVLNFSLPGIQQEKILPGLSRLGISTGSACHSGAWTHSRILQAIGRTEEQSKTSFRISLGRPTTAIEISEAIEIIKKSCLLP